MPDGAPLRVVRLRLPPQLTLPAQRADLHDGLVPSMLVTDVGADGSVQLQHALVRGERQQASQHRHEPPHAFVLRRKRFRSSGGLS